MKLKRIRDHKNFNYTEYNVIDLETTGFLKYQGDLIFSYSITNWFGETIVLRFDNKRLSTNRTNRKVLQRFLDDTSITKISHHAKFEISFLKANGFTIPRHTVWHCTLILSQYLNNLELSHKLDFLAKKHFKYPTDQDTIFKGHLAEYKKLYKKYYQAYSKNPVKALHQSGYHTVSIDLMDRYQIADGERCMLLYQMFAPELYKDKESWGRYLNDLLLIRTSERMEEFGIEYDYLEGDKLLRSLKRRLSVSKHKLLKLAGWEVNTGSDQQVAKLLYDQLGFKCTMWTVKGARSTSKDYLMDQRELGKSKVFDLILQVRSFSSGISSIETYKSLVNTDTGILNHNINTNKAKTGRQSVNDPALQTVQKLVSAKTIYGIPARKCFKANKDAVLFFIDYAGIELRLIIEQTNEEEMIEVINSGGDVHDEVSEEIYQDNWRTVNLLISSPVGVKIPDWLARVNPKDYDEDYNNLRYIMRAGIKDFEFGTAYGGSFDIVTKGMYGLSTKEKRKAVRRFEKRWPGIAFFTNDVIKLVKKQGYVRNVFGRKLYIPRGKEYSGANYIIQNLAGEILKEAENRLDDYFYYTWGDLIRMIVTVHDELILSFPKFLLPEVKEIMKEVFYLMTEFYQIKVNLEVEADVTESNWASSKKFKL